MRCRPRGSQTPNTFATITAHSHRQRQNLQLTDCNLQEMACSRLELWEISVSAQYIGKNDPGTLIKADIFVVLLSTQIVKDLGIKSGGRGEQKCVVAKMNRESIHSTEKTNDASGFLAADGGERRELPVSERITSAAAT